MTALPPNSDFVTTGISKGTFKAAMTGLRAFLAGLFGSDGTQATALAALGVPLNATVVKSGAYTVVAADRGKVISCSGTWTLSITAAASLGDGFVFGVYKPASGTITLDPNLTEQIDGATTKALPKGLTLIYCDGSKFTSLGALDSAAIVAALGFTPANATHNHDAAYADRSAFVDADMYGIGIANNPWGIRYTRADGTTYDLQMGYTNADGTG